MGHILFRPVVPTRLKKWGGHSLPGEGFVSVEMDGRRPRNLLEILFVRMRKGGEVSMRWALVLFLGLGVFSPLGVVDANPVERTAVTLSLEEAVRTAIVRNLSIREAQLAPLQVATEVEASQAFLDPRLRAGASTNERRSAQPSSDLDGVSPGDQPITRGQNYRMGVDKQFAPGTEVGLSAALNRASTNSARAFLNPEYRSEFSLDVRQPLLRGYGREENLADFLRALSNLRESRYDFRRRLIDLIADVEVAYLNFAAGELRRALARSDVEVAKRLVEENRERFRLGAATRLEVLQSESSLASRQESLILAEQSYENAWFRLTRVLGFSMEGDLRPIEVDDLPTVEPLAEELAPIMARAFDSDPELMVRSERLERGRLNERLARRQVRPSLDLVGGAGVSGTSDGFSQSTRDASDGNGRFWNVGVEMSMPWDFRAERARLRSRELQVERDALQMEDRRADLAMAVRQAFRDLQVGRERYGSAQLAAELNEEAYEKQVAEFEAGGATFRSVIEAQRDLEEARLRLIEARINWAEARVRIGILDGTLLLRHGLEWELTEGDEHGHSHHDHHHHSMRHER